MTSLVSKVVCPHSVSVRITQPWLLFTHHVDHEPLKRQSVFYRTLISAHDESDQRMVPGIAFTLLLAHMRFQNNGLLGFSFKHRTTSIENISADTRDDDYADLPILKVPKLPECKKMINY